MHEILVGNLVRLFQCLKHEKQQSEHTGGRVQSYICVYRYYDTHHIVCFDEIIHSSGLVLHFGGHGCHICRQLLLSTPQYAHNEWMSSKHMCAYTAPARFPAVPQHLGFF